MMINRRRGGRGRFWKGRLINNRNRKGTENDWEDYNWEAFGRGLEGRRCFYFTNNANIPGRRCSLSRSSYTHKMMTERRLETRRGGPRDPGDQSGPSAFNCGLSTHLQTFPRLIRSLMPHHPFALVSHRVRAGTSPPPRPPVRGRGRERPHRLTVRSCSAGWPLPCAEGLAEGKIYRCMTF